MSDPFIAVNREEIARCETLIRPYVRRTPTIEVDGTDLGLGPCKLCLKLELLQHSGSFKARGAFTNLLARKVPAAGVVAASGGNHGAAVAYAAMRLQVPQKSSFRACRRRPRCSASVNTVPISSSKGIATRTRWPQAKLGWNSRVRCPCTRLTNPKRCSAKAL